MTHDAPLHGGQLRQISERFGIPAAQLIDFSANINPDGPPPSVLSTLRASLDDPTVLSAYPDLEQPELKAAIAQFAGISRHTILVGSGFVPLLECALRLLKIKRCLLPVPGFVEYRRTLERAGVDVTPHPHSEDSDFRYQVERLTSGDFEAILLANPQNPSGVLANKTEMLALIERAAARRMIVLLDEAFIDYAPAHSLAREAGSLPNLIVFRSVTKFFAIPGLRVAYAVANEAMTKALHDASAPWQITTLAARAVAAALADEDFAKRARIVNERRSGELKAKLEALGLRTYPSAANFLLFRLPELFPASLFWQRLILEHNLVLRDCSNYEALSSGHMRTAVRTERENSFLANAIEKVLSSSHSRASTL